MPVLEVFLFDFEGDLYGRDIEVEFIDFIRADRKFDSRCGADRADAGRLRPRASPARQGARRASAWGLKVVGWMPPLVLFGTG